MPNTASLLSVIAAAADARGGRLGFDEYMDLCLHHPLGYYGGGRANIGAGGDFVTAPVLSPLFSDVVARAAQEVLAACGGGDVLELGAGGGELTLRLAEHFEKSENAPALFILETSAAMAARQRKKLRGKKVQWLSALPENFRGVIIANEVLDAVPCRLFINGGDAWQERGVTMDASGAPRFVDFAPPDDLAARRLKPFALPRGALAEINPRAEALTATLAARLNQGCILFFDYGFARRELYHPQRTGGTIMCHRANQSDSDPLDSPGEKDITAHVDFTAIAESAADAGAKVAGFVTLANFLINGGILNLLEAREKGENYLRQANAAHKLLAPHEMGEIFKVMAVCKGGAPAPAAFAHNDRRERL